MQKVLIEFLDTENIENIISLLKQSFDKVVYFYSPDDFDNFEELKKNLSKFIRKRFLIAPKFISIDKYSFDLIAKSLSDEIQEENEYTIDITGGSAVFISASGYLAAKAGYRNIKIQHFEIESGRKVLCYPSSKEEENEFDKNLSVEETVQLNEAIVDKSKGKIKYNLSEGNLEGEILRLWKAVGNIPRQWNNFCVMAHTYSCKFGKKAVKRIYDTERDKEIYREVASKLKKYGIISGERTEYMDGKLYIVYNLEVSDNAFFLYDKGGTILEMYTYLTATKSRMFTDICVGVPVDWDGESHSDNSETTNEIDLLLMSKHIPIYISCKNKVAENAYLYEIKALYSHYCGKYAKTVLITNSDTPMSIKNRASDMGIILIDNVGKLSFEKFMYRLEEITGRS